MKQLFLFTIVSLQYLSETQLVYNSLENHSLSSAFQRYFKTGPQCIDRSSLVKSFSCPYFNRYPFDSHEHHTEKASHNNTLGEFYTCRDMFWKLVNPVDLLQKKKIDALEELYTLGLWDLRAKCDQMEMDKYQNNLHMLAKNVHKILVDSPSRSLDDDEQKLGIEGATENEEENMKIALDSLKLPNGLYMAGNPNFPRNFVRDSVIASILLNDTDMLLSQIKFASLKQGVIRNSNTGEEPGKIFHEYPGFPITGKWTDYNACDATALYVIGIYHAVCAELNIDPDNSFSEIWKASSSKTFQKYKVHLERAVFDYIVPHIDPVSGLFFEDPKMANADKFALKVTYWKDSKLLGSQHVFPTVYGLAHAQNLRAIKCAAKLIPSKFLQDTLQKMRNGLHSLFDEESGLFAISRGLKAEKESTRYGVSSDSLTALYFLDKDDIPLIDPKKIELASAPIETVIGYATETIVGLPNHKQPVAYHLNTVWPFEQGLIHAGAVKHQLSQAMEVSSRVVQILLDKTGRFPELASINDERKNGKIQVRFLGCSPQLWSIASAKYFYELK